MHDLLSEARTLVGESDGFGAIDILLNFASSQLGDPGASGRRFSRYRDEVLLHSAALNQLERDKRQGIEEPEGQRREERRISRALLGLIEEIDRTAQRSAGPLPVPPIAADIPKSEDGQLEKIWGRNTLQSLAWLHHGLRAGRAVCRVITPDGIGTGFAIRGGHVVTNNHVVPDAAAASETRIEFNFERDANGNMCPSTSYSVKPDSFVTVQSPLDCTVLRVAPDPGLPPVDRWGALDIDASGRIEVGEPVTIIQHPNGGEKQIALTANEVVNIFEHRLHYLTDTMRGSSGAPVFNNRWQVVALHRAGGKRVASAAGARIYANEGTLFSHLAKVPELRAVLGP